MTWGYERQKTYQARPSNMRPGSQALLAPLSFPRDETGLSLSQVTVVRKLFLLSGLLLRGESDKRETQLAQYLLGAKNLGTETSIQASRGSPALIV